MAADLMQRGHIFWHGRDLPATLANDRSWGVSGLNADVALGQFMTRSGHSMRLIAKKSFFFGARKKFSISRRLFSIGLERYARET